MRSLVVKSTATWYDCAINSINTHDTWNMVYIKSHITIGCGGEAMEVGGGGGEEVSRD